MRQCRSGVLTSDCLFFINIHVGNVLKKFPINYIFSQSSDNFGADFVMRLIPAGFSICAISPFCYYSTVITLRLQQMADDIYHSLWYKLPAKFMKHCIISIVAAQQPRYFTGLGLVVCSLETFKKVNDIFILHFTDYLCRSEQQCCINLSRAYV